MEFWADVRSWSKNKKIVNNLLTIFIVTFWVY